LPLTPLPPLFFPQVGNPFAIDWPLLQAMPAADKLLFSGALLCLFREIFVKSATVGILRAQLEQCAHHAYLNRWTDLRDALQIGACVRNELRRLAEFHFACVQPAMESRAIWIAHGMVMQIVAFWISSAVASFALRFF
jgi:hypothetical protein